LLSRCSTTWATPPVSWMLILFWEFTVVPCQREWPSDLTQKGDADLRFLFLNRIFLCDPSWMAGHTRASDPQLTNRKRNLPCCLYSIVQRIK
jgi:hypothetical protein